MIDLNFNQNLPNGIIINGVCYINQESKPTARPDNSPLIVGDRWYNLSAQTEWVWNGTYWVSAPILTTWTTTNSISTGVNIALGISIISSIFIEKMTVCGAFTGTVNETNYHTIIADIWTPQSINLFSMRSNTMPVETGSIRRQTQIINTAYLNFTGYFSGSYTKVGSPGNVFNAYVSLQYREISL